MTLKQSDLGLHCLSRPFLQTTSVFNFRAFTIFTQIFFVFNASTVSQND